MKPPIEIKDIRDFAYITSRKLQNARDEQTGEVCIWRRKGEERLIISSSALTASTNRSQVYCLQ